MGMFRFDSLFLLVFPPSFFLHICTQIHV
uniref:Uncharacterized protein n=1 Tax=Rhizophora mucronata TaxID=61149 RepID=A0A2P2QUY6_RHIMU